MIGTGGSAGGNASSSENSSGARKISKPSCAIRWASSTAAACRAAVSLLIVLESKGFSWPVVALTAAGRTLAARCDTLRPGDLLQRRDWLRCRELLFSRDLLRVFVLLPRELLRLFDDSLCR